MDEAQERWLAEVARGDRLADEALDAMWDGRWERGRQLMLEANRIRREAAEVRFAELEARDG